MTPCLTRGEQLDRLAARTFDVAVIGGGINGAAVARDAAMRGLKVALIDKGDFAGGTSSRSSKLIHGGLRYLAQGRIGLVREALHERERLRRLSAQHLVWPTRFLLPSYDNGGLGRLGLSVGLRFYDWFARLPKPQRHRMLSAAEVSGIEPALKREGLRGGATYYDASTDDARLTWENALDASEHGAVILNYVALESFGFENGRLAAASLRDVPSARAVELQARVFVNATGPWADDVRRLDEPDAAPIVRLTKGCHLLIPSARFPVRETLALSAAGGRLYFVMPRDEYILIGTTDTDFNGSRERVAAEPADVAYLLEMLSRFFPGLGLNEQDIESSFAGLRALVAGDGNAPSSVSREEMIHESRSGLLTIAGGKLSTHRAIAQRVTDRVMPKLGLPIGKCPTLDTPLPGARALDRNTHGAEVDPLAMAAELPPESRERLRSRYGTRAPIVAELALEEAELARPLCDDCAAIGAEVVFASRTELASTLADCLMRRLGLACNPRGVTASAPAAAKLMARELGWSVERERSEQANLIYSLGGYRSN